MARPARLNGGRPADGRATILDVAAAAGVSRQTVTRAMNGMPGISAETSRRVREAAAALRYRPSRFGRGLVTGGERQLGLVLDDLRNPYFPELAAAVVARAAEHGWNVLLADAGPADDPGDSIAALGPQVDAVIGYFGARMPAAPGPHALPVVRLGDPLDPELGGVRLDLGPALADLAAHLAGVGVRSPVVIDPTFAGVTSPRGERLRAALEGAGMPARVIHAPGVSAEAGAAGAASALAARPRPDAIVAFNDIMAIGALAACRAAGARVPDDVRVAGIDGLPLGELVFPTLTTLALDLDEVARHAVDLAIEAPTPLPVRAVRHRLVVRDSA